MAWVGKAVYDFTASSLEEVDLRKGDVVRVHPNAPSGQVLGKHWLYGTVYGRGTGLVPTSCLTRITPPPILASFEEGDSLFVAGEGYIGQDPAEDLSFSKGEFVIGHLKLSEHWMFGYSADGSRSGRFPLSLVLDAKEDSSTIGIENGNNSDVSFSSPTVMASPTTKTGKAVVVENVKGQLPGELTVQKGDKVHVLGSDSEHWLRCRLDNGSTGLISAQVVRFLDEASPSEKPASTDVVTQYGTVLHDFSAEFDNELPCRAGERVGVLEFAGSDWVRARSLSSGREGLVPASFVDVEVEEKKDVVKDVKTPQTNSQPSLSSRRLKALYDFNPECSGDLRLRAGLALEWIEYCDDENWIRVRDLTTGEIGVCPSAYVTEDSPVCSIAKNIQEEKKKTEPVKAFSATDFALAASSKKPASGVSSVDSRIEKNLMNIDLSAKSMSVFANVTEVSTTPTSTTTSTVTSLVDVDFTPTKTDSKYDSLGGLFASHDSLPSSALSKSPKETPGRTNGFEEHSKRTPPARPTPPSQVPVPKVRPSIPPRPIVEKKVENREESMSDLGSVHPYPRLSLDTSFEDHAGDIIGSESPKSLRSAKSTLSLPESEEGGDVVSISGNQPMDKRDHVVKEILTAERDYIRHLKTAVEVFGLNDTPVLEEHGMDSKAVFGNLLQVIDVAEKMESSLASSIEGVEPSEQRIGGCFLQFKNDLEEAYLKYCLHYSKTSGVLARYTTIPKDKELLDGLAYNIRSRGVPCLNVDTILIEPVQHVLKYHLLLSELIRATDKNHVDMVDLWEAHRVALERNTKINETGRVTELLEKYSKTKSGKMSHMTMRSISKGAGRFATSVATSLGLASETKCEVFDERSKRFKDTDDCIKAFRKWVSKFVAEFGAVLKLELSLCDSLSRLFEGEGKPQEVERFWSVHYSIYSDMWPKYESQLSVQVSSPLGVLSETLERPRFLIEKRRNKMLDYDKLRNKMARIREPTVQMREELDTAQKTYEALNSLLIQELPSVVEVCRDVVSRCFLNFFVIRKKLCGAIFHELMSLSELPLLGSGHANIYDSFFTKHKLVCHQMSRLSLLAIKFQEEPIASQPGTSHGLNTSGSDLPRRPSKSPRPTALLSFRQNSTPTEISSSKGATAKMTRSASVATPVASASVGGSEAVVRNKFPAEKIFTVERDFSGSEEKSSGGNLPANFAALLLAARKGDVVGVIKRELPSGGNSHWFVDNGAVQGFLPKEILKPETQRRSSAASASSSNIPLVNTNGSSKTPSSSTSNQSHLYDEPPSYEESVAASLEDRLPEYQSRYENLEPKPASEIVNKKKEGLPVPKERTKTAGTVKVVFDYEADTEVELSVKAGDLLVVVSRGDNAGNKDWLYVEHSGSGKRGYVPASFVAGVDGSEQEARKV